MRANPPGRHVPVLVMQAIGFLWLFRVLIWCLPYDAVSRFTARLAQRRRPRPGPAPEAICRAVERAGEFVFHDTCLVQSLAAYVLLSRRGYDAHIRYGVAKRDGAFQAHAWVEVGEAVALSSGDVTEFTQVPLPQLNIR